MICCSSRINFCLLSQCSNVFNKHVCSYCCVICTNSFHYNNGSCTVSNCYKCSVCKFRDIGPPVCISSSLNNLYVSLELVSELFRWTVCDFLLAFLSNCKWYFICILFLKYGKKFIFKIADISYTTEGNFVQFYHSLKQIMRLVVCGKFLAGFCCFLIDDESCSFILNNILGDVLPSQILVESILTTFRPSWGISVDCSTM